MNTRRPIRDSPEPIVLSVSFNNQCTRFVCGMENGLRVFRAKDCIRTQKESLRPGHNIAIAEALDDRYVAVVGGGRLPNSSPNALEFWDLVSKKKMTELDMGEPIIAVRVTHSYLIVVLVQRTVCLEYTKDTQTDTISPGTVKGLYHTADNPHGLCCIFGDTLALPGETPGQVQVLTLTSKDKKVFKASESPLRQMALSKDGALIATASETGTIIRIYSTSDPTKSTELRRGLESASIWGLAFNPSSNFLASTSDKGTLHIWDLRPPCPSDTSSSPRSTTQPPHRTKATSSRLPHDYDTISHTSGSIPNSVVSATAGYMPPPPNLHHLPPSAAPSLTSLFNNLTKGSRSTCSTSFSMGTDPPNWQGQPSHTSTTLPSGATKKLKNENVAVAGRRDGKPPKGVLCWDLEHEGRLWVVGGGMDAQWEVFELVGVEGRNVGVEKKGFRRFLTRQFPEKD